MAWSSRRDGLLDLSKRGDVGAGGGDDRVGRGSQASAASHSSAPGVLRHGPAPSAA